MALHPDKTKFMLVTTRQKRQNLLPNLLLPLNRILDVSSSLHVSLFSDAYRQLYYVVMQMHVHLVQTEVQQRFLWKKCVVLVFSLLIPTFFFALLIPDFHFKSILKPFLCVDPLTVSFVLCPYLFLHAYLSICLSALSLPLSLLSLLLLLLLVSKISVNAVCVLSLIRSNIV